MSSPSEDGRHRRKYAFARFPGEEAYACGRFAEKGDAQTSRIALLKQTSDATESDLPCAGNAAFSFTPFANTTWGVKCTVIARRADADLESGMWEIKLLVHKGATGVGEMLGLSVVEIAKSPTLLAMVSATFLYGTMRIKITGEAGKTINWIGMLEINQIIG